MVISDGDRVRRIVIWLASTVTVVVLIFGYPTSTNSAAAPSAATPATTPETTTGPSSSSSRRSSTSSSTSASPAKPSSGSGSRVPTTKTYTGAVAQTRWGPVQVEITVKAGTITKVDVLRQPSGNPRDTEINAYALPILMQETSHAQSAKIDMVSGATVTSNGYLQSLQSALDQAGI